MTEATAVAAIKSTVDNLRSLSVSDKTLKKFYSNHHTTKDRHIFHIHHITKKTDGILSLVLCAFHFKTETDIVSYPQLHSGITQHENIQGFSHTFLINPQDYDKVPWAGERFHSEESKR